MGFDKLLTTKKVLICCGSGGVGKTTLSAALGVRAAELGKKAIVLTIDPAKRLANSLGFDNFSEPEKRVVADQFPGELYAEMLDMKHTFDDFIVRLAPSPEIAEKVLKNHVYQQLSTALNGSQEYTSLERLLQLVNSNKFDIVILDTPPTKHAIDFLMAPSKIHTLFQDSIMKWFMMPFSTIDKLSLGLMNRGTKVAFKLLEKFIGAEFLTTIGDFFSSIRDWQKALRDRTAEVHRLMTSSSTGFILVTGFNSAKIEEARYFENSLKKGGYELSAIIVNRAFPQWNTPMNLMGGVGDSGSAKDLVEEGDLPPELHPAFIKLRDHYEALRAFYENHQQAYKNFEMDLRSQILFVRLPDVDQEINDIQGLQKLAAKISSAPERK